jgi:biopolymer transport protein ExbB/TolQ
MMIFGRQIAGRLIAMVVGAILIIVLASFALAQCQKRRSEAAQSRVERSQAEAASNSAADAIGTVAASGKAEAASEELTRSNERDIRNAEGAGDSVKPAVRDAGIAALCRRKAYANDPRCRRP